MRALQQVDAYLQSINQRFRLFRISRGSAAVAIFALLLTLVLVSIGDHYRFAAGLITPLRFCLIAGITSVVIFGLILPLLKVSRVKTARLAEDRYKEFGDRLLTLSERKDTSNPFNELIAEDALKVAYTHPPSEFVPAFWFIGSASAALLAVAVLMWLIHSGPGAWGYGASLLWTNSARAAAPLYDITVTPGNTSVRRRTDQLISAQLVGFASNSVVLHAKYAGALKWEQIPMQSQVSADGFQFLFTALSDSLEYYVEAAGSKSKHFTLTVKDLPAVKHLRVTVHFPAAIGLPDSVEDPGGDIRAVQGSKAEVRVLTDKPLQNGLIVMEDGSQIPLAAGESNWLTATLPIKADGSYHLATRDKNEVVRLTDNYIIESRKDEAPKVSIIRPGKDPGVNPIEELPVAVTTSDDFGLHGIELHYSVNGGTEQVKSLGSGNNGKSADVKTVLSLEDYKLSPGDLVSFYATAKDATHTSRSDIVFAKVEPFDLKFRESQAAGGGGSGAGGENSKISERQKDIIAATWNQIKEPTTNTGTLMQNANFLSELESKLGDQAKALSERMGNRELGQDSEQFKEFSKSMLDASAQMAQAKVDLKDGKWNGALGPEQKGLQAILHAESIFRDIQVSMSQSNGSGSGGGGGQERELARLLDLELDTAKNQYESAQSGSKTGQDESQKTLNEELERLKELARRQQQLASEQHSQQQQFQQRWEEEQLRREAEQLRQQLAEQQQQSSSQSQSASASSSSQSSSQSSSSQSGGASSKVARQQTGQRSSAQSSEQREAMRKAIDALSKAEDEMRNAASKGGDQAAQQRSANQLSEAQKSLRDMLHQQASGSLGDLAERSSQLAASQNDLAKRIKKQYGAEGVNMARTDENGKPEMPEMNGPGYGGWYRRRQQLQPEQPSTNEEKRLAEENDKLAEQLDQLQNEVRKQAQLLTSQQPNTTKKLRKALSDAEQEEIAVRMRKSSEWLREGYGSKTWPVEDGITAATQHLSRQLQEAKEAGEKSQSAANKDEQGSLGQALAEVRSLREQLQSRSQAQSGQKSSGQSSSGQSSQGSNGAASASSGRTQSAVGAAGGQDGQQQSEVDQLAGIKAQFGRDDRPLSNSVDNALGAVQRMNGQNGLLDARLASNAMLSLERLELELSKRMQQKAGARTNVPETVPDNYRDAVATYFRTLSK